MSETMSPAARSSSQTKGDVTGVPLILLRLEGLGLLAASACAYDWTGGSWGLFAWLFLLPDIAMLGYLAGPAVGAATYNTTHTTMLPIALGIAGLLLAVPTALSIALIWLAHVGFDRAMGYGLKYASAFGHTHLGQAMGKARRAELRRSQP